MWCRAPSGFGARGISLVVGEVFDLQGLALISLPLAVFNGPQIKQRPAVGLSIA